GGSAIPRTHMRWTCPWTGRPGRTCPCSSRRRTESGPTPLLLGTRWRGETGRLGELVGPGDRLSYGLDQRCLEGGAAVTLFELTDPDTGEVVRIVLETRGNRTNLRRL